MLKFRDSKKYKDRLASAQKETGEKDALVVMKGTLYGMPVVAAAFEFAFMGGSMGSVVGARFVRAVEHSLAEKVTQYRVFAEALSCETFYGRHYPTRHDAGSGGT